MALLDVIWPVALVIGVGHEIAHRARSQALRELAEGVEAAAETGVSASASVPFRSQSRPQEILRRASCGLEGHSTGTGHRQPVAIRRWVADRRREPAVRAVFRQEVVELVGEVHKQ
jgi:hypothetical protein